MLTPDEARELWPAMRIDDLLGAIWLPGRRQGQPDRPDPVAGQGRPPAAAPGSSSRCGCSGFDVAESGGRRRVTGVRTDQGDVEAEVVVNCAGQWAKALGRPGRRDRAAALRRALLRRHRRRSRACTRTCRSCATPTATPTSRRRSAASWSAASSPRPSRGSRPTTSRYPFEFQLLEEDWEHFSVLMDEALRPHPGARARPASASSTTAPRASPPTTSSSSARRPSCDGFFVGAGFNSVGIASAGGAGRALAEWIVAGEATSDLLVGRHPPVRAVQRQQPLAARAGSPRCSACTTTIPWPNRELTTARPFRLLAAARPARGEGRAASARGWAGSGPTSSRRPGRPPSSSTPGASRPGCPGRPPSSAPAARRSRSSTRPRSPSTSSRARTRSAALQWVCANDVDVDGRALRLHRRCSTRAAPTSPT